MNYVPYAAAAWLLLAVGYRAGGTAPIFVGIPSSRRTVDPVVQALTLTDVVVSVTVTALLLAIALQIHKGTGSLDPARTRQLRG